MTSCPPSLIILISVFFGNCETALIGYLTNVTGTSVFELVGLQSISMLLIFASFILLTGSPDRILAPPGTRVTVGTISALGFLATLAMYLSLHQLTLAEHMTVSCTLPFVTAFVSWIWLGDKLTRAQVLCCAFSVIGVALIIDPARSQRAEETGGHDGVNDGIANDWRTKVLGVALCQTGVCALAFELLLIRRLGDKVSSAQILVVMNFLSSIATPLIMVISWQHVVVPTHAFHQLLVLALVVVTPLNNLPAMYAGQRMSPVTLTICIYISVALGTATQWMLYGNIPSATGFVGMALVLLAGLYLAVHDARESLNSAASRSEGGEVDDTEPLLDSHEPAESYSSVTDRA